MDTESIQATFATSFFFFLFPSFLPYSCALSLSLTLRQWCDVCPPLPSNPLPSRRRPPAWFARTNTLTSATPPTTRKSVSRAKRGNTGGHADNHTHRRSYFHPSAPQSPFPAAAAFDAPSTSNTLLKKQLPLSTTGKNNPEDPAAQKMCVVYRLHQPRISFIIIFCQSEDNNTYNFLSFIEIN